MLDNMTTSVDLMKLEYATAKGSSSSLTKRLQNMFLAFLGMGKSKAESSRKGKELEYCDYSY